ncbi:MAG: S41 family peptidase [Deltaproteobacteria bacterium]|nr:S41 family peptidase [Deltaproteobacteria bacterium]
MRFWLPFFAGAILMAVVALALPTRAVPRGYSPYRKLGLFARVLSYVENNYVNHVDGTQLIYGAIRGMMQSLDTHSVFLTPDQYKQLRADTQGQFSGIGIEVEFRQQRLTVVAPLEGTPAYRAGIRSGDEITHIDGASTREMRMDQAVRAMRGRQGTAVKLQIARPGAKEPLTLSVMRDVIKIVSVTSKRLTPQIGYIRIKNFQERTAESLRRALRTLREKPAIRGLVLDMRNNPGGLLDQAIQSADLLLSKGRIVTTIGKGGRVLDRESAHRAGTFEGFPIVCLVNGGSASAAEILAGALQDHKRAVIMGEQTFGKGSVQTIIELADGSGLKLTVARYFTPAGRSIQEHGITPDILVQSTEPPKRRATDKVLREKDLKRHLSGEPSQSKPGQRSRLKDFQLQTALDYLRAAQIFRTQDDG